MRQYFYFFSSDVGQLENIVYFVIDIRQVHIYDAVSDVVESGVHWRSDFQIGSRVLKICFKPIFLCISMACNMISCIEVAEITQTLKIADFTM